MTVAGTVVHEIAASLPIGRRVTPKNYQMHGVDEVARVCNLTLGTTHEH